jgi:hypothetical protein
MPTRNWRIRKTADNFFFVEGDLPEPVKDSAYPTVEVLMEDYGEHNGYTEELRMEDAKLIVAAPGMQEAIKDVLELLDGPGSPNLAWMRNRLAEALPEKGYTTPGE